MWSFNRTKKDTIEINNIEDQKGIKKTIKIYDVRFAHKTEMMNRKQTSNSSAEIDEICEEEHE